MEMILTLHVKLQHAPLFLTFKDYSLKKPILLWACYKPSIEPIYEPTSVIVRSRYTNFNLISMCQAYGIF